MHRKAADDEQADDKAIISLENLLEFEDDDAVGTSEGDIANLDDLADFDDTASVASASTNKTSSVQREKKRRKKESPEDTSRCLVPGEWPSFAR